MIGLEEWVDIVAAYRRGISIRQISRDMGVGRNTVRRAIAKEGAPKYVRPARPTKLDPYKDYLDRRLRDFPHMTAAKLYREITALGYDGCVSRVADYTRPVRARRKREVAIRFETPPGKQAQCDFTELGYHEIGGVRFKLYIFVMILGYSRMAYAQVTLDMGQSTFFGCHKQAFAFFGGVPQEILYDNPKTIVDSHRGPEVKFNAGLLDFAGRYGYSPKACRPYRAQTKGKVERFNGYLKDDFLQGEVFDDLNDMQRRLIIWLDTVANVRKHATTGRRPVDMFTEENLAPFRVKKFMTAHLAEPVRATPGFYLGGDVVVPVRPLKVYEEVAGR